MSQISERYYLIMKMQENYIKLCELSMKSLEVMEKESESTESSDIKSQMQQLVIENLNLFQGNVSVESIQGDKIMSQTKKDNIEVQLGNNAHISGDFIVAKSIDNSFNKISSSGLSDELKILLKELSIEVGKMVEHLPKDEAEEIAEDFDTLSNQVISEKPKRKWWSVSIDGLTKAAENLGKIGTPVLELISKIVPLLVKISV